MEKTVVQEEFEKICMVPRYSGHNDKIIKYCIEQAESLGYEVINDEKNGNVIIKMPAAQGKENNPGLVLQGHLDMVAAKTAESSHDFDNDPLDLRLEGDYYYAKDTTLGGDDGVAPAICFALLKEKNLSNPPLEMLLTTDEEIGMLSVREADLRFLKGKYLINLDNEEEGYFVVGCCGGTGVKISVPIKREEVCGTKYTLKIEGLLGGHSGQEIDTQRANAIKLMGQLLFEMQKKAAIRLISIKNVGKDNIIANNCTIEFVADCGSENEIMAFVDDIRDRFRFVFRETDKGISIKIINDGAYEGKTIQCECLKKLTSALLQLPYGVINLEQQDFTKVETSANLGVIETLDETIDVVLSIRSSVEQRCEMVVNQVEDLCEILELKTEVVKEYPAWLPDFNSPLIEPVRKLWKKMYSTEPVFDAIHAGLECGVIMSNSNIEAAISMGPTMEGIHTVNEKLSIGSLNRSYDFVKALVESF